MTATAKNRFVIEYELNNYTQKGLLAEAFDLGYERILTDEIVGKDFSRHGWTHRIHPFGLIKSKAEADLCVYFAVGGLPIQIGCILSTVYSYYKDGSSLNQKYIPRSPFYETFQEEWERVLRCYPEYFSEEEIEHLNRLALIAKKELKADEHLAKLPRLLNGTVALQKSGEGIAGWKKVAEECGIKALITPSSKAGWDIESFDRKVYQIPETAHQTFRYSDGSEAGYDTIEHLIEALS